MKLQLNRVFRYSLLSATLALTAACQATNQHTSTAPALPVSDAYEEQSFTNPLFNNGADPWLEYFDGNYYLTTTTWTSQLVMRKSPTLAGLAEATPVYLWSETDPASCCNFWAYEFHRLKGPDGYRWYMMFTSGQQENLDGQHLTVLESAGDDPMGPYQRKGSPMPDSWNIDGNYLEHNGKLYLLWSEWVADEQLNWIAEMVNPWTITGPRMVLSRPEYDWEMSGRKVNEGAEVLKYQGRTFVVYSGSYCDTPDYKLGLLELTGDDPMDPTAWKKYDKPVFERGNGVYGPGHNGFFKSPDDTEHWLVYHGNNKETDGCSATRSLRAQPFSWHADGTPDFGEPVPEGQTIAAPAGENGPVTAIPQGADWFLQSRSSGQCLTFSAQGQPQQQACSDKTTLKLDPTTEQFYRVVNNQGQYLGVETDGSVKAGPWFNKVRQQWAFTASEPGYWRLVNKASEQLLSAVACAESEASCADWLVVPAAEVAIVGSNSGKVLSTVDCKSPQDATLTQDGWTGQSCQQWQFRQGENGKLQLSNLQQPALCAQVAGNALGFGAGIVLGSCDAAASAWYLAPNQHGSMQLVSAHSQHALEVPSCSLFNGAPLAQGPADADSFCQRFHIRAVR